MIRASFDEAPPTQEPRGTRLSQLKTSRQRHLAASRQRAFAVPGTADCILRRLDTVGSRLQNALARDLMLSAPSHKFGDVF